MQVTEDIQQDVAEIQKNTGGMQVLPARVTLTRISILDENRP
jgi:hypothetical protein